MKFKSRDEIKEIDNNELGDYATEFLQHFDIKHPLLVALIKRFPNNPNLRGQIEGTLLAAHTQRKVWEEIESGSEVSKSSEEMSLSEHLDDELSAMKFEASKYKLINETVFENIRDNVVDLLVSLAEDDPEIIKVVTDKILKKSMLYNTKKLGAVIDRISVSDADFRESLFKLAAFYQNKNDARQFYKGLADLSGVEDKNLTSFNKEIRGVMKELFSHASDIIKQRGLKAAKLNDREADKVWKMKDRYNSEIATNLDLMLLVGKFKLAKGGVTYFNINPEEHGEHPKYGETLANIKEIVDVLSTVYKKEAEYRDAARGAKDKYKDRFEKSVVEMMEFATKTEVPEQKMVYWHFLISNIQKQILPVYEKAFDEGDDKILGLVQAMKDKYNIYNGIDSPFYDKSSINPKKVGVLIENGSPLLFCLEASLLDEARRMAEQGKYLDIVSTSTEQKSYGLLPSEFAKSINFGEELISLLAASEEKFSSRNKGSDVNANVMISSKAAKQLDGALSSKEVSKLTHLNQAVKNN